MASRIAFGASVIALIYAYAFSKKNLFFIAPVLVSLGIAWSSSISFGYPYPILYATGIILSFLVLILKELRINPKFYFWMVLPICIIAFSYNLRPYREANIFKLTYSLESVSPKLKYIKTSKSSFEKYSELKVLVDKYGENFIVAPSLPIANYLFNNQSELPADWIIETEVNRRQVEFIKLAADKKNFIFIEKSFLNHEEFVQDNLEKFSSISVFIYKKFNLIDETKYFLIYNSINKDERLP